MDGTQTPKTDTRRFFLLVAALTIGVCYAVRIYAIVPASQSSSKDNSLSGGESARQRTGTRNRMPRFGSGDRMFGSGETLGSGDMMRGRFGSGEKFGSGSGMFGSDERIPPQRESHVGSGNTTEDQP